MRNFIKNLSVTQGKTYIQLQVSNISKAVVILERHFDIKDYSVKNDNTIWIYDTALNIGEMNKTLVTENVDVFSSGLINETLEDYFKKITGGEGIG